MKGELRPGGLAVIIKSRTGHNLGKMVELIDFVKPGDISSAGRWLMDEARGASWCVKGNDLIGITASGITLYGQEYGFFTSSALMPINDPGETQETETTKKAGVPS